MKIYGDSISGNCLKVKWVCESLRVSYDWIETSVVAAQTRTAEFLALNPAGQVPMVVLDDGRPLAQSNAIILHLAEGSDLIPADAYARARMLEWMFWEQYSHEPYIAVARFQLAYLGKTQEDLDPKVMPRGRAALQRMEDGSGPAGSAFLVERGPVKPGRRRVSRLHAGRPRGTASTWPAIRACKAWVGRVETGAEDPRLIASCLWGSEPTNRRACYLAPFADCGRRGPRSPSPAPCLPGAAPATG